MDHLECPDIKTWEARRLWFEQEEEGAGGEGSYLVSEQACALIAEVQSIFCAGDWAAVIILAAAIIDAQLRETELPGFRGNTARLIDAIGGDAELHQLRRRRNALVHVDPDNPALTVDQQWSERDGLEEEARAAVQLMFRTFYMSPGL
jgi:hypothetical protein